VQILAANEKNSTTMIDQGSSSYAESFALTTHKESSASAINSNFESSVNQ